MTKSNNFITCHPDAGFLQVAGPDAAPFLQSILTSNVETLAVGACRPSALLTPQGRVLIDMMLYRPTDHTFILRTDAGRRDDLFAKLRRYRLRRPVELLIDNDLRLAIYLGDMPLDTTLQPIAYKDPRGTGLGHHILFRHIDDLVRFAAQNTIENIDETGQLIGEWQQRRIAAAAHYWAWCWCHCHRGQTHCNAWGPNGVATCTAEKSGGPRVASVCWGQA